MGRSARKVISYVPRETAAATLTLLSDLAPDESERLDLVLRLAEKLMGVGGESLRVQTLRLELLGHASECSSVGRRSGLASVTGVGKLTESHLDESLLEGLHLVEGAGLEVLADVASASEKESAAVRHERRPNSPSVGLDDDQVALTELQVGIFDVEEVLPSSLELDDVERGVGGDGVERDATAEGVEISRGGGLLLLTLRLLTGRVEGLVLLLVGEMRRRLIGKALEGGSGGRETSVRSRVVGTGRRRRR